MAACIVVKSAGPSSSTVQVMGSDLTAGKWNANGKSSMPSNSASSNPALVTFKTSLSYYTIPWGI